MDNLGFCMEISQIRKNRLLASQREKDKLNACLKNRVSLCVFDAI